MEAGLGKEIEEAVERDATMRIVFSLLSGYTLLIKIHYFTLEVSLRMLGVRFEKQ
jgi:hypothetical protein